MNKPVIITIFLILMVMLTFLFAVPQYNQYRLLQAQVAEKRAQYSGESIYFARISDILSGLESRRDVLDKIQSALPADFSLAPLVDFLQKKADENGIKITAMVFSQMPPVADQSLALAAPGQVKDLSFTLDSTGSYQGLKDFLFAMDNSARLFEVDTLSFLTIDPLSGARAARNQPPQYSLKLEVRTRAY
ncbi:MAG: hypothetical protein A3C50_02610 [Candidatus Staskawiczbacteria bacterium RIFCSPHIGHO2_02_FULL_43_16]|uniref:Pilus assembly protein PilO n=1 Tax=Candidatus Staskawiczbacteria bacterium RIFCSPHIGHO2_01_FULL_41_41 TaxID=1802203 RepID=A0A1G2HX42_9BACT|nr:MAG: hypothetical protein A2822_01480 [Candidatus Staskawiczbacteria bacterium RIFCSPHIGHO2_01_FULL_41_41]OGZ68175.1 MAG: hypothetical protein A3C50_02610 [Candidatus Staskawiczbacteria bacterium RIFCSPHIGHO2_02_FULL_43_16]OGZ74965.1 MAG: hypothetical protein A3A12_04010 [Candidatus Staskawiczbacteria bacterium RIFCSPLOWO2_01_FULL_43_17b]